MAHAYATTTSMKTLLVHKKYAATKITVLNLPDSGVPKLRSHREYTECFDILTDETARIARKLKNWLGQA